MMNEDQEMLGQGGEAFANVGESWAVYDTVQICSEIGKQPTVAGFGSYAGLAAPNEIPFFNVRNSGEVGEAMTNLETKDQMPYAFDAYSIGVRFSAPLCTQSDPVWQGENGAGQYMGKANPCANAIFIQEIPLFAALKFKVQQDEKLIHTAYLAPEGSGPMGIAGVSGFGFAGNGGGGGAGVTSLTQGYPTLQNRWKFPVPIGIPRGATMSAKIVFTDYAKRLLAAMPGPDVYTFYDNNVQTQIGACATIRVSLIGKRLVQQRGQIHR